MKMENAVEHVKYYHKYVNLQKNNVKGVDMGTTTRQYMYVVTTRFKKIHDKHINSKINKINEKIPRIFMIHSPNNPLSTRTDWF